MAITADFYNFAKRKNSTKIPSSQPTTYNITLKDDCSITNPVIGLDIGIANNPHNYNYCKIASFGRWYYVSDWVWSGRLWWATLSVDVLATYKTYILNNSDYIVRAGTGYDGKIIDVMYPATGEISITKNDSVPSNIWSQNFYSGCYVAGVINSDSNAPGAVSYYIFDLPMFTLFRNYLLTDTSWTNISVTSPDIGDDLFKSLFNPFQYIVSINWFPFTPTGMTLRQNIKIGWWDLQVPAYTISNADYVFQVFGPNNTNPSVIAYDHPQTTSRGFFVNMSPFTTHRLYAPPWGEFELDADAIANGQWITPSGPDPVRYVPIGLEIRVDLISGIGSLRVYMTKNNEQYNLLLTQTTISVPIPLAQINTNAWGEVKNIAMTASSGISNLLSGNIGGVISNAASGILNSIENKVPRLQTIGSNGAITPYIVQKISLQTEHKYLVNDAIADKGRPVCKYDQLGNYSGYYVQTSGAHVDIAGYEDEINEINTALDGGVYLE